MAEMVDTERERERLATCLAAVFPLLCELGTFDQTLPGMKVRFLAAEARALAEVVNVAAPVGAGR